VVTLTLSDDWASASELTKKAVLHEAIIARRANERRGKDTLDPFAFEAAILFSVQRP
jgi:hypothetical protein